MKKSLLKSTMLLAAVLSLGTSLSSVVLAEDAKPAATTTFEVKDSLLLTPTMSTTRARRSLKTPSTTTK